jgi:hypothetical protein
MASNTLGWLQRAQTHPATFTGLRTGQWPKHPRPVKEEKPGKDPAFLDDGAPSQGPSWLQNVQQPQPMDEVYRPDAGSAPDTPFWQNPVLAQMLQDNPNLMPTQTDSGSASTDSLSQPGQAAPAEPTSPSSATPNGQFQPDDQPADIHGTPGMPAPNPDWAKHLAALQAKLDPDQPGGYPVNKAPAWWQRVLGGIAGGAAGVSNASGHTRHPIDIGAMKQNILSPGYQDKLNQWNSEYAPLAAEVNMDAAQRQAQLAQQKQQLEQQKVASEDQYRQAEGKRAEAQANYWNGIGKTNMVKVTPALSKMSEGAYEPGQMVPGAVAEKVVDRWQTKTKGIVVPLGSRLVDSEGNIIVDAAPVEKPAPNVTDAQLAYLAAQGDEQAKKALDLRVQQHNQERTPPNPEVQAIREENRESRRINDNQTTDERKIAAEAQAQARYQSQVNAPNASAEQKAQAQGQLISSLQGIQDAYARTVRARGGAAQDLNVVAGPQGVQYVPRTPGRTAPPAGGSGAPRPVGAQAPPPPAITAGLKPGQTVRQKSTGLVWVKQADGSVKVQ